MRNSNLDIAKALACIGVILMHCSFPGIAGKFAAYLFKFAVPLFFMISGYFLFKPELDKEGKIKSLKRKIWHILKILLAAELLSAIFFNIENLIRKGTCTLNLSITELFINSFTGTFFNGTLWFLYSLLWSYVIIYIFKKTYSSTSVNINYIIIGLGVFLIHILLRISIKNLDFYDVRMFRNAIMYGLPFILIGYGIRKSEASVWYKKLKVTNPILCILLYTIGYIISIGEYTIHHTSIDIYVGTIISTWAIFTFCVSYPTQIKSKLLTFIGEKLSLYVYIIHLFVIDAFSKLSEHILYKWILPFIVIFFSIFFAYIYYQLKSLFIQNNALFKKNN